MTVKIALFAEAKQITGCEFIDLDVDDEATVGSLKEILADRYPDLVSIMERSTWAVDHEYVGGDKQLYHGAEVGLIPPVSGG